MMRLRQSYHARALVIEPWFGVFVPAGTPAAIVARLYYPLTAASAPGCEYDMICSN
jgi:hypothetical protein